MEKYKYEISQHISRYLVRNMKKNKSDDSRLVPLTKLQAELKQAMIDIPGTRLSKYKVDKESVSFTITWDDLPVKASVNFRMHTYYCEPQTFVVVDLIADSVTADMYYENEEEMADIDFIIRLAKTMPAVINKIPQMVPHYEKLEADKGMKAVKRQKIHALRRSSAKTMLDDFCQSLTVPYYVFELENRMDLSIKLPECKLMLTIEIPLTKFQHILPQLPELIQTHLGLNEQYGIKTLISRVWDNVDWEENNTVQRNGTN